MLLILYFLNILEVWKFKVVKIIIIITTTTTTTTIIIIMIVAFI